METTVMLIIKRQTETEDSCFYHSLCQTNPFHFIASPHCQDCAQWTLNKTKKCNRGMPGIKETHVTE